MTNTYVSRKWKTEARSFLFCTHFGIKWMMTCWHWHDDCSFGTDDRFFLWTIAYQNTQQCAHFHTYSPLIYLSFSLSLSLTHTHIDAKFTASATCVFCKFLFTLQGKIRPKLLCLCGLRQYVLSRYASRRFHKIQRIYSEGEQCSVSFTYVYAQYTMQAFS